MKLNLRITAAFGMATIILATISCSKVDSGIISDDQLLAITEDVIDDILIEEIIDEILGDLEKYDFLKSSDVCPLKTIDIPEEGRYPKVVTLDFGEGCYKNDWSRMRSGKIILTINGPWHIKGSVREVAFDNYIHGKTLVEGGKRIECMGETEEGYIWHKIKGNIKLTRERDGESLIIKREVEKDRYLINGLNDRDVPNEWLIEGEGKVEKANGLSYEMKIAEPLYRIQGCRWFQAG